MSLTYVLQIDGPESLVKFGRSRNPRSRIASLKTGLPWPCRVVALIGTDIERDLKREFAGDNVSGEWFRPSERMQSRLDDLAQSGSLVRQVPVDRAYVNAVIKPRIVEYLEGREPANNPSGDLVRCILADLLPTIQGREADLKLATKGHVTDALARGWCATREAPQLFLPSADASSKAAA